MLAPLSIHNFDVWSLIPPSTAKIISLDPIICDISFIFLNWLMGRILSPKTWIHTHDQY